VASFADWKRPDKPKDMGWGEWDKIQGSDAMRICLAVGPIVSRTIMSVCLKNNEQYLSRTLKIYREEMVPRSRLNHGRAVLNTKWAHQDRKKCADWAGDNHRAWMSVNTDWQSKTTDELMRRLQRIPEDAMERKPIARANAFIIHPYMAFNNVAVAVELGLVEVIKYLIEEKNVDINSFRWNCYYELKPSHLVNIAIETRQVASCEFLLSCESVDLFSAAHADALDPQNSTSVKTIFEKAVAAYIKLSEQGYVDAFLGNPNFDINARKQINRDLNNVPCLHLVYSLFDHTLFNTWRIDNNHCERYLRLLKLLMDKGAKTNAIPGIMMSPLKHAQKRLKELVPSRYKGSFYSMRAYGRSSCHKEFLEATIGILSRDTTIDLDRHWSNRPYEWDADRENDEEDESESEDDENE